MPTEPPPDPRPAPPPEPEAPAPTLDELVACVERELRLRRRVYPNLVRVGKMQLEEANHELLLMRTVLQKLLDEAAPRLL